MEFVGKSTPVLISNSALVHDTYLGEGQRRKRRTKSWPTVNLSTNTDHKQELRVGLVSLWEEVEKSNVVAEGGI